MDKKMFLVRVACGAGARICAFTCVSEHLECENSQIGNLDSPHEPTS